MVYLSLQFQFLPSHHIPIAFAFLFQLVVWEFQINLKFSWKHSKKLILIQILKALKFIILLFLKTLKKILIFMVVFILTSNAIPYLLLRKICVIKTAERSCCIILVVMFQYYNLISRMINIFIEGITDWNLNHLSIFQ